MNMLLWLNRNDLVYNPTVPFCIQSKNSLFNFCSWTDTDTLFLSIHKKSCNFGRKSFTLMTSHTSTDPVVSKCILRQEGLTVYQQWACREPLPPSILLLSVCLQGPYHAGKCIGSWFCSADHSSWKCSVPAVQHSFRNCTENEKLWIIVNTGLTCSVTYKKRKSCFNVELQTSAHLQIIIS